MEPIILAGMVLRALLPAFAKAKDKLADRSADELANGAAGAIGKLYGVIRSKLSGDSDDPYDRNLLAGVETQPTDESRVQTLEQRIAQLISLDTDFATALESALADIPAANDGVTVHAENSGV